MIQSSPLPIYAVSTDMKILYCNQALCDLTGHDDEFLTELTCVYQTATDQPPERQLACGLCPPPDCFQNSPCEGWISIPVKDEIQFRRATFLPNRPTSIDPSSSVDAKNAENTEDGVIVFVHGPPLAKPELNPGQHTASDSRSLHTAICQMQYESSKSISIDCLVGTSFQSQRTRRQITLAGQAETNVVIVGPKGSGRRKIAPLIHFANGPELAGPLVPIECSLSDMESMQETIKELHRTSQQYPEEPLGRLFLQDVDLLPEAAQYELVGFLSLPEFQLPLIATTTANGHNKVLPELWQHLSTLKVEVLSLVDRRQDIPYLAQAVVEQFNDANHKQLAGIDEPTMEALVRYAWPAELNELIEVIDAACMVATESKIRTCDLPQYLRIAIRATSAENTLEKTTIDLDAFLAEIEDELIRRAVAHTKGNKSEAARLLGISRPRLLRRLGTSPSNQDDQPEFIEATDDDDEGAGQS